MIQTLPQLDTTKILIKRNKSTSFNRATNTTVLANGELFVVTRTVDAKNPKIGAELLVGDGTNQMKNLVGISVNHAKYSDNADHSADCDFASTTKTLVVSKGGATVTQGNTNTPVYFNNGVPVPIGFTIKTSVPDNAVFTDTNDKVRQTEYTETLSDLPLMFTHASQVSGETNYSWYSTKAKWISATNTLTCNISGSAAKLGTTTVGASNQIVYLDNGRAVSGIKISRGTSRPLDTDGNDGDIYIQYV